MQMLWFVVEENGHIKDLDQRWSPHSGWMLTRENGLGSAVQETPRSMSSETVMVMVIGAREEGVNSELLGSLRRRGTGPDMP